MANIFKSKFTGEQIDEILQKAQDAETPIEVQANPQGDATVELDKLKVGDTIYETPRPIDVVANPTSVGEADLTKLRVGTTVYNIPQPQAPTTVVANPQGTPTGSLEKLQVGNDIYEIPIEANPDEPAIENLDKLRVGQDVYSIPTPTAVIANPIGGGDIDLNSIQVGDTKYNIPEAITVAANPLQQATDTLSKLQVGSTVYSIPNEGGGGGSGGTQLYDHTFSGVLADMGNVDAKLHIISTTPQPFELDDSYMMVITSTLEIVISEMYSTFIPNCLVSAHDASTNIVTLGAYIIVDNQPEWNGFNLTTNNVDVVTPL